MDWLGECKLLLNRPKVVHRLPGRMRVHVRFLRKLPKEYAGLASRLAELLAVPRGIESASASLTTGNVLICFDPTAVTEDDVLAYLRDMFEIFVRNRERFEGLEPNDADRVFGKLEVLVRDEVKGRLQVDSKLVLEKNALE